LKANYRWFQLRLPGGVARNRNAIILHHIARPMKSMTKVSERPRPHWFFAVLPANAGAGVPSPLRPANGRQ